MTTLPFLVVGDCAELGCVEPQPTIGDRGTYLPTCIVLLLFFPSIQVVAESCYYGTEIPLPCMRNLKTGPDQ